MTTDLKPDDPAHSDHLISTNGLRAERIWHPDVPMFESVQTELIDICCRSTFEHCGFIDSEWNVHKIPNVHAEPQRNFYMDSAEAEQCLKRIYDLHDLSVLGIWHTHPNNVVWPSPRDIAGWPNLALHWRYWVVTNKCVYEWELVNG